MEERRERAERDLLRERLVDCQEKFRGTLEELQAEREAHMQARQWVEVERLNKAEELYLQEIRDLGALLNRCRRNERGCVDNLQNCSTDRMALQAEADRLRIELDERIQWDRNRERLHEVEAELAEFREAAAAEIQAAYAELEESREAAAAELSTNRKRLHEVEAELKEFREEAAAELSATDRELQLRNGQDDDGRRIEPTPDLRADLDRCRRRAEDMAGAAERAQAELHHCHAAIAAARSAPRDDETLAALTAVLADAYNGLADCKARLAAAGMPPATRRRTAAEAGLRGPLFLPRRCTHLSAIDA